MAADGLWLSAAYETDVLGIHFTWRPDEAAVAQFLPALESALVPFEARPHWGKLFDVDTASERLPSLYPRWEKFRELRRELDPSGKFLNDFLRCLKL